MDGRTIWKHHTPLKIVSCQPHLCKQVSQPIFVGFSPAVQGREHDRQMDQQLEGGVLYKFVSRIIINVSTESTIYS